MEGLLSYSDAWLVYAIASLMGWWCWCGLFFWLSFLPFVRHLVMAIGAVLVFTPAPISAGSTLYAPAFVVTSFSFLSEGVSAISYTYFYWISSSLIAISALIVIYLLVFLFKALRPSPKDAKETSE